MKPIQVASDIIPIARFKSRASEIVRAVRSHGRPTVITQNGAPAAVLLSPEEFDRLTYQERFRDAIREGLADVEAGRVISGEEMDESMDRELGRPR